VSQLKAHRRLSLTSPTIAPTVVGDNDSTPDSLPQAAMSPAASVLPLEPSKSNVKVKSPATKQKISANSASRTKEAGQSATSSATPEASSDIIRVMAYLAADEAEQLDEVWLAVRRAGLRASKSDILRAALRFSSQKTDELLGLLSQQHNSTLSRHRDSKMRRVAQSE